MERSLHIIYSLFFIIASAISQMEIGGNRRLVNILTASHQGFAGHDLGDKFLLI